MEQILQKSKQMNCQDVSIAGKQRGLEGARSGLFFSVIELVKSQKEEDKPSILFIENVKNLISVNRGWDFANVLISLDEAGYDAEWQVLNSKDFGVPQNRERVFIIGHLRGRSGRKVFPIKRSNGKALKQILGGQQGNRIYDTSGVSCTLASQAGGQGAKTGLYLCKIDKPYIDGKFVSIKDASIRDIGTETAGTITARYYKGLGANGDNTVLVQAVLTPDRLNKRQNGRRFKELGEPMFTLTTQDKHGVKIEGRIRRLTPKECFRLQGFPDEYFEKARAVNSDTQLYKQAGNSVTVNVVNEIAKRL